MTTSQGFSLTEVLVSLFLISTAVMGLLAQQSNSAQMLTGLARKNLQRIEQINQLEMTSSDFSLLELQR